MIGSESVHCGYKVLSSNADCNHQWHPTPYVCKLVMYPWLKLILDQGHVPSHDSTHCGASEISWALYARCCIPFNSFWICPTQYTTSPFNLNHRNHQDSNFTKWSWSGVSVACQWAWICDRGGDRGNFWNWKQKDLSTVFVTQKSVLNYGGYCFVSRFIYTLQILLLSRLIGWTFSPLSSLSLWVSIVWRL